MGMDSSITLCSRGRLFRAQQQQPSCRQGQTVQSICVCCAQSASRYPVGLASLKCKDVFAAGGSLPLGHKIYLSVYLSITEA